MRANLVRVRGWTVAEPILEREEGALDIAPRQGRESEDRDRREGLSPERTPAQAEPLGKVVAQHENYVVIHVQSITQLPRLHEPTAS